MSIQKLNNVNVSLVMENMRKSVKFAQRISLFLMGIVFSVLLDPNTVMIKENVCVEKALSYILKVSANKFAKSPINFIMLLLNHASVSKGWEGLMEHVHPVIQTGLIPIHRLASITVKRMKYKSMVDAIAKLDSGLIAMENVLIVQPLMEVLLLEVFVQLVQSDKRELETNVCAQLVSS